MTKHFVDVWGDTWKRVGWYYVIRLKDDNMGGWFDGKGLKEL